MKVYIYKDAAYPVYGIVTDKEWYVAEDLVEIPDSLYERYKKIEEEYGKVQAELEKYSCE